MTYTPKELTPEERDQVISTVQKQCAEIGFEVMVTCGKCGAKLRLIYTYRCIYCGIWFCYRCAKEHFE